MSQHILHTPPTITTYTSPTTTTCPLIISLQATAYPGYFSGTNNQSSPADYSMMPYDVSASAMAQSIQNGFGSVYAVNVVRSTNRWVVTATHYNLIIVDIFT